MLDANHDGSDVVIFTKKVGVSTNDFSVHLNDNDLAWDKADADGMSLMFEPTKLSCLPVNRTVRRADGYLSIFDGPA